MAALQPQTSTDKHRIVEIDEACKITRKAKPTIYTLARNGLIPAYKRGKKLYFYEDELLQWIESVAKVVHNFFTKKSLILKPSLQYPSILNMNSLNNNNKMETKVVSFEQLPELIQNLVERVESLEKTVREKQQPQPLEGELMSVEDVCKLLGKSKSAVYRTVRYRDIPYIRQGNRLDFASATYSNCNGATLKWAPIKDTTFASALRKPKPRQPSPSATKHWNYAANGAKDWCSKDSLAQ